MVRLTTLSKVVRSRYFLPICFLFLSGAVLDKNGATVTWNMSDATDEALGPFYKLLIKQILLGHKAKENEYNVVEVRIRKVNVMTTLNLNKSLIRKN